MALTDETTQANEAAAEEESADQSSQPTGSDDATPCADQPLSARIEALLLATDRPLTESRLAELMGISGKSTAAQTREAIDELNAAYEATGRTFRIERLAGGFQFMTVQTFGPLLARFHTDKQQTRLSQAALETLAIIAYRQPIMRAEIEAIRGVACGEVLRGLLERRLITIAGRAEELGRPMLYGTTREFLRIFGLASLDDLPKVEGLSQEPASPKRTKAEKADETDDESENQVPSDAADADDADDSPPNAAES